MGLINLQHKAKLYWLYRTAVKWPAVMKDPKYWEEVITALLSIKEIRLMLTGYKTILIAIVGGAVTVAHMMGYIDDVLYNQLMILLGTGAVGTVAAKLNRINQNQR